MTIQPKQCEKPADVLVLIESTGPGKEHMEAAISFLKKLAATLSESLNGVQVSSHNDVCKICMMFVIPLACLD